jgi:hypothetical protein
LFSEFYNEYDDTGKPIGYASLFLKKFSAPFIKKIGHGAFNDCENLIEINFPKVEIIGVGAFS